MTSTDQEKPSPLATMVSASFIAFCGLILVVVLPALPIIFAVWLLRSCD